MHLERLRLFAELVNLGSYTQTADKLGVSKAYLSKHIKSLEKELSTQLLIRNTRSMRLTQSGEALFNHTNRLCSFWDDTQRLIHTLDEGLIGEVNFTAPAGLMKYIVMPVLYPFLKEFPDIHLNAQTSNQTHNLYDTQYDFAVRITTTPPQDMVAYKLFDFDYITCASKQYIDICGAPISPLELEEHARISLSYWQRWIYHSNNIVTEISTQANYRFTDNELIKQGVKNNLGIARLPSYMIKQELEVGDLVSLFDEFIPEQKAVYLLYPSSVGRPARVQKIIDHIKSTRAC